MRPSSAILHFEVHLLKDMTKHDADIGDVFRQEHPTVHGSFWFPGRRRFHGAGGNHGRWRHGQVLDGAGIDRQGEGAALAQLADDFHIAAERPGQASGDGQPEARAAVAASRRGIHLREGLKKLVDLVGGDADAGVRNGELHARGAVALLASSGASCGPRRAR